MATKDKMKPRLRPLGQKRKRKGVVHIGAKMGDAR